MPPGRCVGIAAAFPQSSRSPGFLYCAHATGCSGTATCTRWLCCDASGGIWDAGREIFAEAAYADSVAVRCGVNSVADTGLPLAFGVLEATPRDEVTGEPLAEEEYFERVELGGKTVWRGAELVFIDAFGTRPPVCLRHGDVPLYGSDDEEAWAAHALEQLP